MDGSNIDEIAEFLDDMVSTFGFDVAGVAGKSLGQEAAEVVAESISEDARNGVDPDGSNWAPNKDPYAAWKARKHGVYDPGYLTGETLSIKALKGEVTITNEKVTMTHGTGAVDTDGASDKEKGVWLTEGDSKRNRPKRRFYELNDKRNDTVAEIMADGLERHVEKKAAGGV